MSTLSTSALLHRPGYRPYQFQSMKWINFGDHVLQNKIYFFVLCLGIFKGSVAQILNILQKKIFLCKKKRYKE